MVKNKISVLIDSAFLDKVDNAAKEDMRSRNSFICKAIKERVDSIEHKTDCKE